MAKKPTKPFFTYSQQINNLINQKKLLISDYSYAESKLHDISYHSLIGGYKSIFYNPMTRQYLPGTTFEDIVALYQFDENLRVLVFKYLCHIEQRICSLLSYHFCDTYSENQADYLNPHNYNYSKKNQKGINVLINILTNEANIKTEHNYVVYQRKTYGNVPLWVVINTLTLGQISKLYTFLPTGIQTKISLNYPYVNEKELAQYLKALTHFRNICAHNERLFSYKDRVDIPDTNIHRKLKIPLNGDGYETGKRDLFAVVIAFRYLLHKNEFIQFKKELNNLLVRFSKQSPSASSSLLLHEMGFPDNWNKILRYKP